MNAPQPSAEIPKPSRLSLQRLGCLLGTPNRVRVVGTAVMICLAWGTYQMWMQPESLTVHRVPSSGRMMESIRLISGRGTLKQAFENAESQSQSHRERIAAIQAWLPQQRSHQQLRTTIGQIARRADTELITFEIHRNVHFECFEATEFTCQVRGSFQAIYQLLELLAGADHPIECHAIDVVREEGDGVAGAESSAVPCVATLSLLAPFVGTGTIAEELQI